MVIPILASSILLSNVNGELKRLNTLYLSSENVSKHNG